MKKHIYNMVLLAGSLALLSACDKDSFELDNLIPEEFHKIVYLQTTGKQELTLYNTGQENTFSYLVMKGGSDPSLSAGADLRVLTQDEVDTQYSQLEGVDYRVLDAGSYTLDCTHFDFAPQERRKTFTVSFQPEAVRQEMEGNPEAVFVLPIDLVSSTDSVNANRTSLFLQVDEVVSPAVEFPYNSLHLQTFAANAAGTASFDINFGLTVENTSWDIDCSFGVDEGYVDRYNETNGTGFRLLTDGYTFTPSASLPRGVTESTISVSIDGTGLEPGDYMLPIAVQSTSIFSPSEENGVCPVGMRIMGHPLGRGAWTAEASSDAQDAESSAEYPENGGA